MGSLVYEGFLIDASYRLLADTFKQCEMLSNMQSYQRTGKGVDAVGSIGCSFLATANLELQWGIKVHEIWNSEPHSRSSQDPRVPTGGRAWGTMGASHIICHGAGTCDPAQFLDYTEAMGSRGSLIGMGIWFL